MTIRSTFCCESCGKECVVEHGDDEFPTRCTLCTVVPLEVTEETLDLWDLTVIKSYTKQRPHN